MAKRDKQKPIEPKTCEKEAKQNKHVKAKTKQTNKQKFRVSRQWHHTYQNRSAYA